MSVQFTEEEREETVNFLRQFVADQPSPFEEDDPLPLRVAPLSVSLDELEGECIEWCLQYLNKRICKRQETRTRAGARTRRGAETGTRRGTRTWAGARTREGARTRRGTRTWAGARTRDGARTRRGAETGTSSKAPEATAALVTRTAISEVLEGDLSIYRQDEPDDSLFDTSKLAPVVLNKVHEVCKRWSFEPPCFYKSKMKYESCVHAIKNTRRKMEDKHVLLSQFNNLFGFSEDYTNQAFYAVYDGHGGGDASVYAATQLHCHLARNSNIEKDPKLALQQAFEKTDECFVKKAKREGLRSGSTGVAVLLRGKMLYVAWLGDSQVVLCKGGQVMLLMNPHKPNREDERQRIEVLGGCVVWFGAWRVNGSLSVSRAIGDAEHKPYISGEPDIMEFNLEGDEDFLVLACDGLWDVVQPSEAVDLVIQHIAEGNNRSSVAKMLVDHAKSAGSNDNISVVVVFLDPHKKDIPIKNNVVRAPEIISKQVSFEENSDTPSVLDSRSESLSGSDGDQESSNLGADSITRSTEDDHHGSSIHTNGNLKSDANEKSPVSSPDLSPKAGFTRNSPNSPKTDKGSNRNVKDSPNTLDVSDLQRGRSKSAPSMSSSS